MCMWISAGSILSMLKRRGTGARSAVGGAGGVDMVRRDCDRAAIKGGSRAGFYRRPVDSHCVQWAVMASPVASKSKRPTRLCRSKHRWPSESGPDNEDIAQGIHTRASTYAAFAAQCHEGRPIGAEARVHAYQIQNGPEPRRQWCSTNSRVTQ